MGLAIMDRDAVMKELECLPDECGNDQMEFMAQSVTIITSHLARNTKAAVDNLDERLKAAETKGEQHAGHDGELRTLRELHVEANQRASALDERLRSTETKGEAHDNELDSLRKLYAETNQRASALQERLSVAETKNAANEERIQDLTARLDRFITVAQDVLEKRVAEVDERRAAAARAEGEGEKRLLAFEDRLRSVESRGTLVYRGVWQAVDEYQFGDFVTWGGSIWHCDKKTTRNSPGDKSTRDWTLAVKSKG